MTCPNETTWLRAEFGELTVNETQALDRHEATCPSCRDVRRAHRTMLDDLAARPELDVSEDAFVERVMSACEHSPAHTAPRSRMRVWGPRFGVFGAAAAAIALFIAVPGWRASRDHIAARGSGHTSQVESSVVQVLAARGSEVSPLEGALLGPGDGIAVRYWNTEDRPRYLAVFAIDAERTVHWIHPAYLDPSTNPSSIPLPTSADGDLLGEVVEPEQPAAGPLRVVAIVSAEPFSVKAIEDRLSRGESAVPERSSWTRVREWSCTWNAR